MPQISICSTPKSFIGHIGLIQENAIRSWLTNPDIEVILCGNEYGVKEMAEKYKTKHIPDIKTNEYGTPLLDDIFRKIEQEIGTGYVCYVSADTMLFFRGLTIKEHGLFLVSGRRFDANVDDFIDFNKPVKSQIKNLKKHPPSALEYWLFPVGMLHNFPPFAVGRGGMDNWLMWWARDYKIPTIDASKYIIAIHQNHDYSHIAGKKQNDWSGEEAGINRIIAGGFFHYRTLRDMEYDLQPDGTIKKKPLNAYKILLDNPIGQYLLGLWRMIRYHLL